MYGTDLNRKSSDVTGRRVNHSGLCRSKAEYQSGTHDLRARLRPWLSDPGLMGELCRRSRGPLLEPIGEAPFRFLS